MLFLSDDYRIFCGDLGNDVSDDTLAKAFSKYPSFLKAKVVRDKWSKKTRGYGFVSFKNSNDFMLAMTEMNGTCIIQSTSAQLSSVARDASQIASFNYDLNQ